MVAAAQAGAAAGGGPMDGPVKGTGLATILLPISKFVFLQPNLNTYSLFTVHTRAVPVNAPDLFLFLLFFRMYNSRLPGASRWIHKLWAGFLLFFPSDYL
jgi:hypothetical protein